MESLVLKLPSKEECKNIGSNQPNTLHFAYSIPCVAQGYKRLSAESFMNMNNIDEMYPEDRQLISRFLYQSRDFDTYYLYDFKHGASLASNLDYYEKGKHNVWFFDTLIVNRENIYYGLVFYLMWRFSINYPNCIFQTLLDYINGIMFGYTEEAIKRWIKPKSNKKFERNYKKSEKLIGDMIRMFKEPFDRILNNKNFNITFEYTYNRETYRTTIDSKDFQVYDAKQFYEKYSNFWMDDEEINKIIKYSKELKPL